MKKSYIPKQILFTLLFCASIMQANASHLVGAYMWYEHVNGNTYNMHLRYFRDCSGIPASPSVTLCVTSASLASSFNKTLPNVSSAQTAINSCAPQGTTTCNGGTDYGVEEYTYADTITLPAQAADWLFAFEECCRNAALTTIVGAAGTGLYTYCTLDNLTSGPNNSPVFPNPFIGLYCAGVLTNIDYSTTDADGDSVVYSLVPAEDAPSSGCVGSPFNLTYNPPYSPTYPLSSFTPITLNSSTGLFSFTPALIQVGEVAILVEEYRNGIKIGSIKRDDQIVIVNGISNPDIIEGTVFLDFNGNGTQDAGEPGTAGQIVTASPGNVVSATDSTGHYQLEVIPGTYTVSIPNPPQWFTPSPASYSVPFASLGLSSTGNDFALVPQVNITDLSVVITTQHFVVPGSVVNFNIHVANEGTLPTTGTLTFHHDSPYSYVSSNPVYDTYTIPDMTWNLPVVNPLTAINYQVTMRVDSFAVIGDTLFFNAVVNTAVTDDDPADNQWNDYQPVVVSCDPNYITVSPAGPVTTDFIAQGSWLYYSINFQNTGPAAANNVDVKNGIDFNADVSTMEFLASSHPCNFTFTGIGLADFNFTNINLPSVGTDEPGSHGTILYRIKAKPTLQPGDYILNAASIYFDQNPAVNTNVVRTDITAISTGINTIAIDNINMEIFPNPANSTLNIIYPGKENLIFKLTDLSGKTVLQKNIYSNATLDIHRLARGLYIYQILTEEGGIAKGKLVKN